MRVRFFTPKVVSDFVLGFATGYLVGACRNHLDSGPYFHNMHLFFLALDTMLTGNNFHYFPSYSGHVVGYIMRIADNIIYAPLPVNSSRLA